MAKKSFTELVKQFEAWYGYVECRDSKNPENVMDLFLGYLATMSYEKFDYQKFLQLTVRRQLNHLKRNMAGDRRKTVQQISELSDDLFEYFS